MCTSVKRLADVRFVQLIKVTSNDVILYFIDSVSGVTYKWVTKQTSKNARDFIVTGTGNYLVTIEFKVCELDVEGNTIINNVKIKRDLMK